MFTYLLGQESEFKNIKTEFGVSQLPRNTGHRSPYNPQSSTDYYCCFLTGDTIVEETTPALVSTIKLYNIRRSCIVWGGGDTWDDC